MPLGTSPAVAVIWLTGRPGQLAIDPAARQPLFLDGRTAREHEFYRMNIYESRFSISTPDMTGTFLGAIVIGSISGLWVVGQELILTSDFSANELVQRLWRFSYAPLS